jgi:plastocyanin
MIQTQPSRGKPCPGGRLFIAGLALPLHGLSLALTLLVSGLLLAQDSTVHGAVRVLHHSESESDSGDVVIWLTPAQSAAPVAPGPTARLAQKNKKFVPHVVAVTQGTEIEFPNQDLFFHNVFSIHQGKTFDLGLYESGAARKIRFSQPGVSYIFCNIHPQMSAVVVVLRTRHFAVTDAEGNFQINHVPPGRYKLAVWNELTPEAELTSQERELEVVSGNNDIGKITLRSSDAPQEHLNKDREPYYFSSPKAR